MNITINGWRAKEFDMKIIKLEDGEDITHLQKDEQPKVAMLKVAGDHFYIPDIGMKDGEYFLLTQTKTDKEYINQWVLMSMIIKKQKKP